MINIKYDNIRKTARAEFIPDIIIQEKVSVRGKIYGFAVEFTTSPTGGQRNLGDAGYFKVYKVKEDGSKAKPIQVVRIFFTRAACVKHKPMNQNWDIDSNDKKLINKYLDTEIGKLKGVYKNSIYKNMKLYSFLLLIVDKMMLNASLEPSIIDDQIIERSSKDPLCVEKDFISIYYPKPDYTTMEYIN